MADVAERGWKRRFDQPIPLPRRRQLVTLKDAGNYITKLPKAEHMAPEWQAAMEALILVATLGGPTMFARIGIMRALNRHVGVQPVEERAALGSSQADPRPLTFPHAIIGMSSCKRNHRHLCIRDARNRSMARETFSDPVA
jgi:hypothetical protein